MLTALRKRQPGRPLWRVLWFYLLHFPCFVWFALVYRFRAWGVRRIPAAGPVLFVANHQSFFDPIIVGLGAHRRQFFALARSGLFDNRLLGWLIRSLNAIPVEQGSGDTRAMRACVNVLKQGQALLVFPEGARTETGEVQPFETGTMLLVKRARPRVVPVAIDGAFDVWPRHQALPRPTGRIGVMYGEPIAPDELLALESEQARELLRERVERQRQTLADRLARQRPGLSLELGEPAADPLLD